MKTFEYEPIKGLPERLPPGESVLWQGAPSWWSLAVNTFRVRIIAGYFGFFVVLRGCVAFYEGAPLAGALMSALMVVPLALAGLGILLFMAWAHARTTLYTLTNKRFVFRYGLALQMMVNLPFKAVLSGSFKERPRGDGDLPLHLTGGTGPSYLHLWPHVRPWRIARPEPMLRSVPEIRKVARIFAEALLAFRESHTSKDLVAGAEVSSSLEQPSREGPGCGTPMASSTYGV